jgi:hypothetical protein
MLMSKAGGSYWRRIHYAGRNLSSVGTIPVAGRIVARRRPVHVPDAVFDEPDGNGAATIVVAKWEGELDENLATRC